jgi:hypothetical protein
MHLVLAPFREEERPMYKLHMWSFIGCLHCHLFRAFAQEANFRISLSSGKIPMGNPHTKNISLL